MAGLVCLGYAGLELLPIAIGVKIGSKILLADENYRHSKNSPGCPAPHWLVLHLGALGHFGGCCRWLAEPAIQAPYCLLLGVVGIDSGC